MSESSNYWQQHMLGRRTLLCGAAVGSVRLAGAALIGCGSSGSNKPAAAPAGSSAALAGAVAAEQP